MGFNFKEHYSRGEIATTLSIVSMIVIGLGLVVGLQLSSDPQSRTSEAQTTCAYASKAQVFKNNRGTFFTLDEMQPDGPFEAVNDKGAALLLNANGRSENWFSGDISFDPTQPGGYARGDNASVTLAEFDPTKWQVKEVFCNDASGVRGCPTQSEIDQLNAQIAAGEADGETIENFIVDCNVDNTYGWVLEPVDTTTEACTYSTDVYVYNETRGNYFSVFDHENDLVATNDKGDALILDRDARSWGIYRIRDLQFDPTGRNGYPRGGNAAVTLSGLDTSEWDVKEVFCEEESGSTAGCPTDTQIQNINSQIASGNLSGLTLEPFRVSCGVDLDYGWVLEPADGRGGGDPDPIGDGPGTIEVRMEAVNFPQELNGWPDGYAGSQLQATCTRRSPTVQQNPLYLSSVEVRATCVGGGCEEGSEYEDDAKKGEGVVTIEDVPAGIYRIDARDVGDRGYDDWEVCRRNEWVVREDRTTEAVIFLANEENGQYETRATESNCTIEGGRANLIEGMPGPAGNMCFFPEGKVTPEPTEEPTSEPTQEPGQVCSAEEEACSDTYVEQCVIGGRQGTKTCYKTGTCAGPGDGTQCSWGPGSYCDPCQASGGTEPTTAPSPTPSTDQHIRVDVYNTNPSVASMRVQLSPCPAGYECNKTLEFNDEESQNVEFLTSTGVRNVVIRDIAVKADVGIMEKMFGWLVQDVFAQENGKVIVQHCTGQVVADEAEGDEKCITHAPGSVVFSVLPSDQSDPPRPNPEPPAPGPGNQLPNQYGVCPVFLDGPCSPEYLESTHFRGEPEENLRKMSALCWKESRGNPNQHNRGCVTGASNDYSVGLFQINTVPGGDNEYQCVDSGPNGTCLERGVDGAESLACIAPLFDPDTNIMRAAGKYAGSRQAKGSPFCPWYAAPGKDPCDLHSYGDSYRGCR